MAGGTYNIYVEADASQAVTETRKVGTELRTLTSQANASSAVFRGLFKFFALEQVISQLSEAGNAFLKVKSDMSVAGFEGDNLAASIQKIGDIANHTRAPIDQLSELFRQLSLYSEDVGLSTEEMYKVVENAGVAIALAGKTANSTANGIIQLAHSFAQGEVQGQNFNALAKTLPGLIDAMAKAAGRTSEEFKRMVTDGEISGKMFAKLAVEAEKFLDPKFSRSVVTLSQAWNIFRNNIILAIADFDKATSGFSLFANALVGLARTVQTLGPFILNLTITLVALRVGLALYAATTTLASTATTLFGNAVLGAQGKVIAARATFAGLATAIVLLGTAFLQFGDKIPVSIGRLQNMQQVMRFMISLFTQFVQSARGGQASMLLLAGAAGTLLLRLGPIPLILGTVGAALSVMGVSLRNITIVLSGLGAALLVLSNRVLALRIGTLALNALIGSSRILFLGAVGAVTLLTNGLIALAAIIAGMSLSGLALAAAIAGLVLGVGYLISLIPGVREFMAEMYKWFEWAWDKLIDWLQKAWDASKKLLGSLGETIETAAKAATSANDAGNEYERLKEEAERFAEAAAAGAKETADIAANASKASLSSGGSGSNGTGTITVNVNSGAGSIAVVVGSGTANAGPATYAPQGSGGGGGGGGGPAGAPAPVEGAGSGGGGGGTFQIADIQSPYVGQSAPGAPYGIVDPGYHDDFAPGSPLAGLKPLYEQQVAQQNAILDALKQAASNTGQIGLTNHELQVLRLTMGVSNSQVVAVQKENSAYLRNLSQVYALQQKEAEKQAAAAAAKQAAEARAQATNQSIQQLTLQALNAFDVDSNSELPSAVQGLIQQIASLQGAMVGMTNPIQAAETGRIIQRLTDQMQELTGAVTNETNAYTKYAQNVYGSAIGIEGAKQPGIAQGSGPPGTALWMGSFADGGNIGIEADGVYAANLHAGETVRISKKESNDRPVVLNMVVNGVEDTEGFRRSKKQIMTSMYRALMAAGEQT